MMTNRMAMKLVAAIDRNTEQLRHLRRTLDDVSFDLGALCEDLGGCTQGRGEVQQARRRLLIGVGEDKA